MVALPVSSGRDCKPRSRTVWPTVKRPAQAELEVAPTGAEAEEAVGDEEPLLGEREAEVLCFRTRALPGTNTGAAAHSTEGGAASATREAPSEAASGCATSMGLSLIHI
eukprot:13153736-Alexandrium_andersonii.AAC.1